MTPDEVWLMWTDIDSHVDEIKRIQDNIGDLADRLGPKRYTADHKARLQARTPHELRPTLRKAVTVLDTAIGEALGVKAALRNHPFMVLFAVRFNLEVDDFEQAKEIYISSQQP